MMAPEVLGEIARHLHDAIGLVRRNTTGEQDALLLKALLQARASVRADLDKIGELAGGLRDIGGAY